MAFTNRCRRRDIRITVIVNNKSSDSGENETRCNMLRQTDVDSPYISHPYIVLPRYQQQIHSECNPTTKTSRAAAAIKDIKDINRSKQRSQKATTEANNFSSLAPKQENYNQ